MSIEKELRKLGKKQTTLNKKELLNLTIVTSTHDEIVNLNSSDYSCIIERNTRIFLFDREAFESLESAAKLIQNDSLYAEIISERRIYEEYTNFVIDTLPKENSISDDGTMIDEFLKKLRTSTGKYKVAMPIERLALLDLSEVRLGHVRLAPFSTLKAEYEQISDFVRTEDTTKIWADVVIETQREREKAIQSGEHEIERIINLLRIYIPILFNEIYNIKIGLNEYHMKTLKSLTIDDQDKIGMAGNNLGPFGNYNLTKKRVVSLF